MSAVPFQPGVAVHFSAYVECKSFAKHTAVGNSLQVIKANIEQRLNVLGSASIPAGIDLTQHPLDPDVLAMNVNFTARAATDSDAVGAAILAGANAGAQGMTEGTFGPHITNTGSMLGVLGAPVLAVAGAGAALGALFGGGNESPVDAARDRVVGMLGFVVDVSTILPGNSSDAPPSEADAIGRAFNFTNTSPVQSTNADRNGQTHAGGWFQGLPSWVTPVCVAGAAVVGVAVVGYALSQVRGVVALVEG